MHFPHGNAPGEQEAPPLSSREPSPDSGDGFARLVAHAINNPLAALVMDLDLASELLEGGSRGEDLFERVEEVRELLVDARRSADRIHRVVADLRCTSTTADAVRVLWTPPPAAPVSTPSAASGNAPRVLVVDDDALVANAVKRTLRNHQVVVVAGALEARALLEAGERFDVVLCDLMMPGLTGMDLHETMLRLAPEQAARMVFVTGGAVTTRARDFIATTQNEVIHKPFDVRTLRQVIARVSSGGELDATMARSTDK